MLFYPLSINRFNVVITFIITLILFGLLLLILEILIIPGLIAGIFGVIMMLAGIFWMYSAYGDRGGHITLISTLFLTAVSIFYAFKSKAWSRFGLKGKNDGRTTGTSELKVSVGDELITISALRPMGTVMADNQRVEAQTEGELVQAGTLVIITKILPNKLIVKPKT